MQLDLSHRVAAHCENGAISALLRYHGIDLSEPMIFGLASGLFFYPSPFCEDGRYARHFIPHFSGSVV